MELDLFLPMKDKTRLRLAKIVHHQADEGQNEAALGKDCPSSRR
jgi:hypothetical protein